MTFSGDMHVTTVCVHMSEGIWKELVFPFHHLGPGNQSNSVPQAWQQCLYPLSHPTSFSTKTLKESAKGYTNTLAF